MYTKRAISYKIIFKGQEIIDKKIVVIGGGTGSYAVLQAVKRITPNVSAIVSMVDDGGSTGKLRDQYGVLPSGDVRQCLLALSNDQEDFRDLISHRFADGDLKGHSFGNILLTALEQTSNNFDEAVLKASTILNITGEVVPATLGQTTLVVNDGSKEIVGQRNIEDSVLTNQRPNVELRPSVKINPRAKHKILNADFIVFAPGSLYDSVISSLLIEGVVAAIDQSSASIVQIVNLVTKPGHTDGWSAVDYIDELNRFLGTKKVDIGIYNTAQPTKAMLKQYTHDKEFPVTYDDIKGNQHVIGEDLITYFDGDIDNNDALALERSLIRHDVNKLTKALRRALQRDYHQLGLKLR